MSGHFLDYLLHKGDVIGRIERYTSLMLGRTFSRVMSYKGFRVSTMGFGRKGKILIASLVTLIAQFKTFN